MIMAIPVGVIVTLIIISSYAAAESVPYVSDASRLLDALYSVHNDVSGNGGNLDYDTELGWTRASVSYKDDNIVQTSRRRLTEIENSTRPIYDRPYSQYERVRIATKLHDVGSISEETTAWLNNTILPAVTGWLSSAFSVWPVDGDLRIERDCLGSRLAISRQDIISGQKNEYSTVYCDEKGPAPISECGPGGTIPLQFMTPVSTCIAAKWNSCIAEQQPSMGLEFDVLQDAEVLSCLRSSCIERQEEPNNAGASDFILLVNAVDQGCGSADPSRDDDACADAVAKCEQDEIKCNNSVQDCSDSANDCAEDVSKCTQSASLCMESTSVCKQATNTCSLAIEICSNSESGESVAGYANTCLRDQLDKPILGFLNICGWRGYNSEVTPPALDSKSGLRAFYLTLHESLHAIGFSSSSLPLFRDIETGLPRTPRIGASPFGPIDQSIEKTISGISSSTVDYFDERGHKSCVPGGNPSLCSMKIVTPAVAEATRRHFACQSIQGAELENQPSASGSLVGSHWETRLFEGDVMAPQISQLNRYVSEPTYAFFQDAGWYRYTFPTDNEIQRDSELKTSIPTTSTTGKRLGKLLWGYGQGCDFSFKSRCLESDEDSDFPLIIPQGDPPHFCSVDGEIGCTGDRSAVGICRMLDYGSQLLPEYTYFDVLGRPSLAGISERADFCPYFTPSRSCSEVGFNEGNATDGSLYGQNSICLESSLLLNGDGNQRELKFSECYDVTCDGTLARILLANGESVLCRDSGARMNVPGYTGSIICPNIEILCSVSLAKDFNNDSAHSEDKCSSELSIVTIVIISMSCASFICIPIIYTPLRILKPNILNWKSSEDELPGKISSVQGVSRWKRIVSEIIRLHPLKPVISRISQHAHAAHGDMPKGAALNDKISNILLRMIFALEIMVLFFTSTFEPTTTTLRNLLECTGVGTLIVTRALTSSYLTAILGYSHRNLFGFGVEGSSKFFFEYVTLTGGSRKGVENKIIAGLVAMAILAVELTIIFAVSIYSTVILIALPGPEMLLYFSMALGMMYVVLYPILAVASVAIWGDATPTLHYEEMQLRSSFETSQRKTSDVQLSMSEIKSVENHSDMHIEEKEGYAKEDVEGKRGPDDGLSKFYPEQISEDKWTLAIKKGVKNWNTIETNLNE